MWIHSKPVRLGRRDRIARAFRLVGMVVFVPLVISFFFSSWMSERFGYPGLLGFFLFFFLYHLMTSIVRCPKCSSRIIDLAPRDPWTERRKDFHCKQCGFAFHLTEFVAPGD